MSKIKKQVEFLPDRTFKAERKAVPPLMQNINAHFSDRNLNRTITNIAEKYKIKMKSPSKQKTNLASFRTHQRNVL